MGVIWLKNGGFRFKIIFFTIRTKICAKYAVKNPGAKKNLETESGWEGRGGGGSPEKFSRKTETI